MKRCIFSAIALAAVLSSANSPLAIAGAEGVAAPAEKTSDDRCSVPNLYEHRAIASDVLRSKANFALDLLTRLTPGSKNASISPFGVSAVLSTLYLCADP